MHRCVCWSNMDECARKSTSRNVLTKASKGVGLRGDGGSDPISRVTHIKGKVQISLLVYQVSRKS